MRASHVRLASTMLALLLPFAAMTSVHAAEHIVVRSAAMDVRDGAFVFTARVDFPADEKLREALEAGATVDLELEVTVDRKNDYWFNERLVDDDFRRELTWNAPSQRFVLRDVDTSEHRTFATLEEALAAAGTFEGQKVEFAGQLDPGAKHEVAVRGRLRRGRMPTALHALTFWTRYWSRSEWYQWELAR